MVKIINLMHAGFAFLDEVKPADEGSARDKELSKKCFGKALQLLPAGPETPEEYAERTGQVWPDNYAVYALYENNDGKKKWFCGIHGIERKRANKNKNPKLIVIAAEPEPPAEDWRPG
jgi:hypothetical protein